MILLGCRANILVEDSGKEVVVKSSCVLSMLLDDLLSTLLMFSSFLINIYGRYLG